MTIEIVKKQILNFLSTDEPEVMAIKGQWGVGKTFAWKKFLQEANLAGGVTLDRYSYVSLFGISSLESLKYSIFENIIKSEIIGSEASVETFRNNAASQLESFGRKTYGFFKGAPILGSYASSMEALFFLSINSTVICIDDLERKGKGLDIKDVLGLVSLLKEQKKCKIVLLLNDGEIGLEDYEKYREKVVDVEIAFAPDPEECALIAYSQETPYQVRMKELVTNLEIRNIRILKKIERISELSLPLLDGLEKEISDQVQHSLVLLSWSYYCSGSDDNIPPLEFVIRRGRAWQGGGDRDDSEQEKKWKISMQAYGYQYTDELDRVLALAVQTGYFDEDAFIEKATVKNNLIKASKSQGAFSDAWRIYHDSFDDNQDELIDGLYESLKENCKCISPSNLNSTVSLFKELGEDVKASELIDYYIENRADESELFDMEKANVFGEIEDQEIIGKFSDLYNRSVAKETAKEVLDRISSKNGWNDVDVKILADTTVDEYYQIFKSDLGSKLSSYIATCLKFGQLGGEDEQRKEIGSRATEALINISKENNLNRKRVARFGILP